MNIIGDILLETISIPFLCCVPIHPHYSRAWKPGWMRCSIIRLLASRTQMQQSFQFPHLATLTRARNASLASLHQISLFPGRFQPPSSSSGGGGVSLLTHGMLGWSGHCDLHKIVIFTQNTFLIFY